MTPERIKKLLPAIASRLKGQRTGWVLATCPMLWKHGKDGSDAFAISYDAKKRSRCKCLSCGYSGDLEDLLLDISYSLKKAPEFKHRFHISQAAAMVHSEFLDMDLVVTDIPEFNAKVDKHESLFPEQWLESFKGVFEFPQAVDYCVNRGIEETTLTALDVRYDAVQERVCFPYRNFKHELMGLQGRYIGKLPPRSDDFPDNPLRYFQYGYMKKRNPHIWMGENTLNMDSPVVVCEGPFDFAKIWQAYENVAASFTSGLSMTKCRRLGDADEIITFYDYGHGGDSARAALRKYLPKMPFVDLIPDLKQEDAGAMSMEDIHGYLAEHLPYGQV